VRTREWVKSDKVVLREFSCVKWPFWHLTRHLRDAEAPKFLVLASIINFD
jgi:hypothetical protein